MLDNPLIKVQLDTDFNSLREQISYGRLIFSGAIDEFFNYKFGELPYRSLKFDIRTENFEYFQNTAVTNYPTNYDFTRICEHKHFLNEQSDKTVISVEYPQEFIANNNIELVKLLLEYHADLDIKDSNGSTPLALAKETGVKEIENLLLQWMKQKK